MLVICSSQSAVRFALNGWCFHFVWIVAVGFLMALSIFSWLRSCPFAMTGMETWRTNSRRYVMAWSTMTELGGRILAVISVPGCPVGCSGFLVMQFLVVDSVS